MVSCFATDHFFLLSLCCVFYKLLNCSFYSDVYGGMTQRKWWHGFADVLLFLWNKSGTLSSLALMLGAMGMLIYYLSSKPQLDEPRWEYFQGAFNHAGPLAPTAMGKRLGGDAPMEHSQMRFVYGDDGKVNRVQHINGLGELSAMPHSRVAEQLIHYDSQGRLVAKENRDVHGLPVGDASGVFQRKYDYNEAGQLLESRFYDAQGALTQPLMPGYAIERRAYDSQGRLVGIDYLDAYQRPVVNAEGECSVKITYDDAAGSRTRKNYVEGALAPNIHGYAVERSWVSNGGRFTRCDWLDENEVSVFNRDRACASIQTELSEDDSKRRELYLDVDGQKLGFLPVPSERLLRLNEDGQIEWEAFLCADGFLCHNPQRGYAERHCEYNEKQQLSREHLRDEFGHPSPCYERRHVDAGTKHRVLSLYRDGSSSIGKL